MIESEDILFFWKKEIQQNSLVIGFERKSLLILNLKFDLITFLSR